MFYRQFSNEYSVKRHATNGRKTTSYTVGMLTGPIFRVGRRISALSEDLNNFVIESDIEKCRFTIFTRGSPTYFFYCINCVSPCWYRCLWSWLYLNSISICARAHIDKVTCKILDFIRKNFRKFKLSDPPKLGTHFRIGW